MFDNCIILSNILDFLCDKLCFSDKMAKGTIFIIRLIIALQFVVLTYASCLHKKPSFIGSDRPKVTQISDVKVILSWNHILWNQECVDQFRIKWKQFYDKYYTQQRTVEKDITELEIEVVRNIMYEFKVIIRVNYGSMMNYVEEDSAITIFLPNYHQCTSK